MCKKLSLFLAILFVSTAAVIGQTITVTGVILEEDTNEPVIGAAVMIKGTTQGVSTDHDGKFTLPNVPSNATLVVSSIGMESVEVAARADLRIYMKLDVSMLEEVLVVAFGEQKRSSFTGSAGVLKSEEILKRQVTNPIDALAGQVAGVQIVSPSGSPTATPQIRIRGFSSINANNDPLIILDGAPYDGGWNNLNPADVESMTVLKDASSNALYGARGANGVIMITTKRARAGEAKITFDSRVGVSTRAAQMYDIITDPMQYYEMHYSALYNSYIRGDGLTAYAAHKKANERMGMESLDGGLGYIVYTVPENQYLIGENGRFNPNATLGRVIEGEDFYITPDNWLDAAYRNAIRQEYNLSVAGGSDKMQFYSSLGYLNNEGIAYGSYNNRVSTRLRASYQAKPWLRFSGNVSYVRSKDRYIGDDDSVSLFAHLNDIAPIYPLYVRDAQGNIKTDENGVMYDYGKGSISNLNRAVLPNTNPIQSNDLEATKTDANLFTANGDMVISFTQDLKLTINGSVSDREIKYNSASQPWYGYVAYKGGGASVYRYRYLSMNFQQLLNYKKSFGKHNLNLLAGHEYYDYHYDYMYGSRSNLFSFYENWELSGAITLVGANSYTTDYNTEGYLFKADYDYEERYVASFSYRRDASSRFHKDHRWGNFWSVGAAWMVNKEPWFRATWVDMLKLKASYGEQGNDGIGDYRYVDQYDITDLDGEISLEFYQKGNEHITWETNLNFNAGVDFELFKGRVDGSIDYFRRGSLNLLTWLPTPISMGYSGYYENIGNMSNQGVEFSLNAALVRKPNFSWSANFNFTSFSNKVTKLAEERRTTNQEGYLGYIDGSRFVGEGLSRYTWRIRKYAGVAEDGRSMWYYNGENGELLKTTEYSDADYYLCGTSVPWGYGGFSTSLQAHGFDLSVNFTYQLGGRIYDSQYASYMNVPSGGVTGHNIHKDMLNAWSESNMDSNIPRWQYNDLNTASTSDRFLISGSYLNFQNVTVGYTLPSKLTKKISIDKIRLSLTCDNIWYWGKRQGLYNTYSYSGSTSATVYPMVRTISGGINIQF